MGNDVSLEHQVTKPYLIVEVSRCTVSAGTATYAYIVNQHTVGTVYALRGESLYVCTMEFVLFFADGSALWVPWTNRGLVATYIDSHLTLPRRRSTGDRVSMDFRFWHVPAPFIVPLGLLDASRNPWYPQGGSRFFGQ